jgi:hypothetical protein
MQQMFVPGGRAERRPLDPEFRRRLGALLPLIHRWCGGAAAGAVLSPRKRVRRRVLRLLVRAAPRVVRAADGGVDLARGMVVSALIQAADFPGGGKRPLELIEEAVLGLGAEAGSPPTLERLAHAFGVSVPAVALAVQALAVARSGRSNGGGS